MSEPLGITEEGLAAALSIKEHYRDRLPICLPGEEARILLPENLLNRGLDLHDLEDPLPLAMVAARDPESPMAVAAITRLMPLAPSTKLVGAVFGVVGETSKHPSVRQCVELVSENDFSPKALSVMHRRAANFILQSRWQYTAALRQNLGALLEGTIAPRQFVKEFFELAEAGNLRSDIRKKLVLSLLLSENIRPSIKFLLLENFEKLPAPVRVSIVSEVLKAEPGRHIEIIKEELKWLLQQEHVVSGVH